MMGKLLRLAIFSVLVLRADLRFEQVCTVEGPTNSPASLSISQAMTASCSREILARKDKLLYRSDVESEIFIAGSEASIILDHRERTWRKRAPRVPKDASGANAPGDLMGLKVSLRVEDIGKERQIHGFPARGVRVTFGLDVSGLASRFGGDKPDTEKKELKKFELNFEYWSSDRFILPYTSSATASGVGAVVDPTERLFEQFYSGLEGGAQALAKLKSMSAGYPLETSMQIPVPELILGIGQPGVTAPKVVTRVVEIDESPIPDSVFEIPKDYRQKPY